MLRRRGGQQGGEGGSGALVALDRADLRAHDQAELAEHYGRIDAPRGENEPGGFVPDLNDGGLRPGRLSYRLFRHRFSSCSATSGRDLSSSSS